MKKLSPFNLVQKQFEIYADWINEAVWEVGGDKYLIAAIAWQETHFDPDKTCLEPQFKKRYVDKLSDEDLYTLCPGLDESNIENERKWRATSWGLMQIMGQTARELGCTQLDIPFWLTKYMGVLYGVKYLKSKLKKYDLPDAVSAYNAGTPTARNRIDYVEPIMQRIEILRNEPLAHKWFKKGQ